MSRAPRALSSVLAALALGVGIAGCEVAVGPDYPGGAELGYPPDAYIATTEPWYLDGQACYW